MVDPCLLLSWRFREKADERLGNQAPFQLTTRGLSGKFNLLPKLYLCEDMFLRQPPLRTQGQTLPLPQPSFQTPSSKAHFGLDPLTTPA